MDGDRERNNAYSRESRARTGATIRVHGITVERFLAMLEEQGGACKLCGAKADRLQIDHDHVCCPGRFSCGACVRGLVCRRCNVGLSYVERGGWLELAMEYLE